MPPTELDTVVVVATTLNLRRAPQITRDNIVAVLHQGQELQLLDRSRPAWWEVRAQIANQNIRGFCKAEFLQPKADAPPVPHQTAIVRVDFPTSPNARLDSTTGRHC